MDSDGFLSRECPECEGRFKVKVAAAEEQQLPGEEAAAEADAMLLYCPLCHQLVEGNKWWTPEQLEFAKEIIGAAVSSEFQRMLSETASRSGGLLEFKGSPAPAMPSPPEEADGMVVVTPPCHEGDPLKIPGDWTRDVACHICGVRYPVDVVSS